MPLLLATILPSVFIVIFFVVSDKFREPNWEIIKIFIFGLLITIPAFFANFFLISFFSQNTLASQHLISSFLTAAPVEEGLKFLVLFLVVYKMKNFNEPLDGMVYGLCVSLGFATLENVYYVYLSEFKEITPMTLAIARAFTAVPAHGVFGAMMGYFFMKYSYINKKDNLFFCFFIPFLLHGFYNLFVGVNFFYGAILIIVAWIIALRLFSRLKKSQKSKRREYEKKI
jgi:RsiW-degrading membrane proteinase PrsW (M82 family)